jgi:GrpB-like predicted nucleotidyltransferase (UPF0157 family)
MNVHQSEMVLVPYDPGWPAEFAAESKRLRTALGEIALRIDHHGSTSIPGLGAKPVIDIQVSVATLQPMAAYKIPLLGLGYIHVADNDDSFCPFFHRPECWPHTHHIHVVQNGGAEERRTLAFRDYLRNHAGTAREYGKLKRLLIARIRPNDRESRELYARAKTAFIERITCKALDSGYPRELL